MWLIVCTIDREYSVVSDKDILSGNGAYGSRVSIAEKGLRKEATVIFNHRTRALCDQYCQRLSRYCAPSESQRAPIDITFLNLPRKKKEPADEELSESSSTHAESLFDKGQVKEEPTGDVNMEVNQEEVTMQANPEDMKPPSMTAAEILMEQHEPAPSTSSEQDDDDENGDVDVEVPHVFFAELLRTMKMLRNECRSRFDRLDDQVEDLAGRVFVLEQYIRRGNGRAGSQHNTAASSTDTDGGGSAMRKLTENDYPYPGLSKVVVDTIQRESKTITSFARKVIFPSSRSSIPSLD
ncbi:hypothetical protein Y032_0688g1544 [Ancylostoma ceylanicum]|uniref:Uncharacterized protein n=1 Tax=Ancylostoma ceylanicum TaxID=53326 RepID=A0A016WHX2_9BILA|nr:hypothetical protein Y032_0688g1544 [Ancylostoma ceylanicum]